MLLRTDFLEHHAVSPANIISALKTLATIPVAESRATPNSTIAIAVPIDPAATSRLGTVPLSFSIGLNQLPPGQYDCQVTVLDPTETKGTFWQGQIMLVP